VKYKITKNYGLLQYPYSVINKENGHTIDNCITFIGAIVLLCKCLFKEMKGDR